MNNHSYDKAYYCHVSVGLVALSLNLLHNSANSQSLSVIFLNIIELFRFPFTKELCYKSLLRCYSIQPVTSSEFPMPSKKI